ncbi:MAG: cobalamin-binding protein [Planctomycetaceae bacterium]|nr:MAG: cobalamin-binding protein [Planctomycetaceae bacterium]
MSPVVTSPRCVSAAASIPAAAAPPKRVVSLIASATEMVYALGCGSWLVGRSHECDYPPEVGQLPACSAANVDPHASSGEIDQQVKAALAAGQGVYRLDTALLESLAPEVILTQHHCEVCAVSLRDVESAICQFAYRALQPRVISLHPQQLEDIWHDIQQVAEALGVQDRGLQLVAMLQARLQELSEQCAAYRAQLPAAPRVVCLEWLDPLMTAGNWMPELVTAIGAECVLAEPGKPSSWITWQQLRHADPDIIILMPCGFDLTRTLVESEVLRHLPDVEQLRAVQHGRLFATDGNHFFNRPGPRVVDSAVILAEIVYEQFIRSAAESHAWRRVCW